MGDDGGDVSKEELSVRLESPLAEGVSPVVLAAVIVGVLSVIALMFSLAFFMDRWNTRLKPDSTGVGSYLQSTKVTILNDMCPDPTSEPPAAQVSLPGTSSEC